MAPSHRLLWRGALAHPLAPLDGIAFVATLPQPAFSSSSSSSPAHNNNALDSPVALALETLRGRPALPVLGTWEGEVDVEQGIRMHINPAHTFTVAYFTRLFCSPSPTAPTSPSQPTPTPKRTCLRLSLGDSPTPHASDSLLLFASPSPSNRLTLEILVGRARDSPARPRARLPRPDDPLPRRVQDLRALTLAGAGAGAKDAPARTAGSETGRKRPLLQPSRSSASLAELLQASGSGADPFLEHPAKRRRLGEPAPDAQPPRPPAVRRKPGKGVDKNGKENVGQEEDMPPPALVPQKSGEVPTLEEANKATIKKHILNMLTNAGCPRSHPDFKDCFSTINRGVVFAMRRQMRKRRVEREEVVRLVGMHVGMYFIPESPVKPSRTRPRDTFEKEDEALVWT